MHELSITALSVYCVDFFPEQDKIFIGGNSLNFAVQCLKQGINKISAIGCIGYDKYGDMIIEYLKTTNIDISFLHRMQGNTASNKIYLSEHGNRYFKKNSWDGGLFESYKLTDADLAFIFSHNIIASTLFIPDFDKITSQNKICKLVVDCLDTEDFDLIDKYIPFIDITFISTKKQHLPNLKKTADRHGKLLAATLGEKGSTAFYKGKTHMQPAIPASNIVDTTGCGDAFQAAFTCSYFTGNDIKKALLSGAKAALKVLGIIGAVS